MSTARTPMLFGLAGFAVALALRLASLDHRTLWVDEALTQYAVSLDWAGLVRDRIGAGHSPLYFLAMKALAIDPANIHSLRLASAVMDATAGGVLAATLARFVGGRAALLGLLFYALHPLLLFWGQNARPYGMTMLWLALGLRGAMGVISHRSGSSKGDRAALSLGLAGASITLTGGAIAALLVALSPLGSGALRGDAGFRRVWMRCMILPALGLLAMLLIVSLPNAQAVQGTYWTQRFLPFTLANLRILVLELAAGDRFAHGAGRPLVHALGLSLLLLQGAAMLWAIRIVRLRPVYLPLISVALAYPLVLVALSASTSLLVARYFLPGVAAGLMLMAAWLVYLSRRRGGAALAVGTVMTMTFLSVNNALSPGFSRNAGARALSDIVFTLAGPQTRLFVQADDIAGLSVQTEILIDRITRGTAPPPVVQISPATIAILTEPAFLVVSEALWLAEYAGRLPMPDCRWSKNRSVLAYWGKAPGGCPALSE